MEQIKALIHARKFMRILSLLWDIVKVFRVKVWGKLGEEDLRRIRRKLLL